MQTVLRNYSQEQLVELSRNLTLNEQNELAEILEEAEHQQVDELCAEWIISHKAGMMYWLRNHTKTENHQWKAQGRDPVAPFPFKPYLNRQIDFSKFPFPHRFTEELCDRCKALGLEHCSPDYLDIAAGYMLMGGELWIPKTREMLTSWLVMGFITWYCQFYQSIGWLGQSEKLDKAQGLVEYANILYRHQEQWLKDRHKLKRGEDEGTMQKVAWANGSWFVGVPQGVRQLASYHPTGYFGDEASHQDAMEQTRGIALPAVRQAILVSSVAPGWWWSMIGEDK